MGKLLSALLFAACIAAPTLASARDWDGWRDGDRREWRHDRHDRDWRRDRWEHRRDWRDHRWSDWRHDRWYRHHGYRYADRDVVCRTYWDYDGYPRRVCYRR